MAITQTHSLELGSERLADDPLILIIPGLGNSGPDHWQTKWEAQIPDAERVELGMWDDPHRNTWVNKINLAVHRAGRPVILVAHSLGCHAVAWWAEYEQPAYGNPVVGALLVAPPDAERSGVDERIARFAPTPRRALPFPAFLAASENDHYCSLRTARGLAADWGATFAYAGSIGHINADSGIDDWAFGQLLLAQLLREHRTRQGIGRDEETATRRRAAARYTRLPWIQSAEGARRASEW
ncbi:alpha/beta hydrolase [Erythrobacter sp. CCH5-A1]|jgi:predicted alpha/beta hydrolase family esterase|uniref:RBBP9/YdeN family alpha/beta hydrolase n=1 Tax=Erythrobacter sp. CCH5-A1 TaxID=1768792 RepID=UPI0008301B11|nr:alpha/beta fold hydrolase [Erythrobacter sp. CCH5-A1]